MNVPVLRRSSLSAGLLSLILVAAANSVTVSAAAATGPATPSACAIAKLPIPDNVAMAIVTAADPTGRILFGRSYPDSTFHRQVLRWENSEVSKVNVPGLDQSVDAVNSAGIAVGTSFGDDGSPTAFLYSGGRVTMLPGGSGVVAHDINADSVVVGSRSSQPVIWRTLNAAPEDLPVPPGFNGGNAYAVDDDGTVVGTISSDTKIFVAFAWGPDGTGRLLPPPGGEQGERGAAAFTVRNGWATGIDYDRLGDESGLRWNLRTNRVEAVPGILIRPSTANTSGWMVGTDLQGQAVMIANDQHIQLPDLVQHEPGTFSNLPETLSDDGKTAAGDADDAEGTIHAVVWHCH